MQKIKNDFSLIVLLLIPVSISLNIVARQIVRVLNIPIFLDTIGTFMISILAGPWAGGVTGLLTNLINGIFNPPAIIFSLVSIAAGVAAGILSKRKMTTSIPKILISAVLIAIITTIIAAPLTVLVFGGATGSADSAITAVFLASGRDIWLSVTSTKIIIEIIDKVFSLLICYGIIKNMSSRYLTKFKYGELYVSDEN